MGWRMHLQVTEVKSNQFSAKNKLMIRSLRFHSTEVRRSSLGIPKVQNLQANVTLLLFCLGTI